MTSLGKISDIRIGSGGYQGAMFGVTIELETKDGSTMDFWGMWRDYSKDCKWTREQQRETYGNVLLRLDNLMKQAKVDDFKKLANKPIEVVWDGNMLKSWRILSEVL